jgi:hypothetical protein
LLLKHREKEPLLLAKDKIEIFMEMEENREILTQFDFNPMSSF